MTLTKDETLERLCALVSKTSVTLYGKDKPHDCFCIQRPFPLGGGINEETILFIEKSVKAAIDNERKARYA